MDTHSPDADGALSRLERTLAACRPAADGLDADAMLFAAGRASVRPSRGRLAWPALACSLALVSLVLGATLAVERAERLALAELLCVRTPAPPVVSPRPPAADEASPAVEPAPYSYLAGQRALEKGLDPWPPRPRAQGEPAPEPPRSRSSVLQLWRRGDWLEQ
jgi:hypothetical protein